MSEVTDLDALIPPSITIKFGGEEIVVNPPKTGDVLRLGQLGSKLQDTEKLSAEELDRLAEQLTEQVQKCIPELTGKEFSTAQLLKLVQIINEMASPPDNDELEKRKVTVDSDPKASSA